MNTLCGGSGKATNAALSPRYTHNIIATIVYGDETFVAKQSYDQGTCTMDAVSHCYPLRSIGDDVVTNMHSPSTPATTHPASHLHSLSNLGATPKIRSAALVEVTWLPTIAILRSTTMLP